MIQQFFGTLLKTLAGVWAQSPLLLQELLGMKVDVISEGGLRERFRQHIMKEAVPL